MRPLSIAFVALVLCLAAPLHGDDAAAIRLYRDGLTSIVHYLDLMPSPDALPTRQQREDARLLWKSFLDYELALEAIRAAHSGFASDADFRLYHAAYLTEYRHALDFIARAERHPEYHTILNEPVPSLGLISGTYSDFKLRWLNVARAAEFASFALLDKTRGGDPLPGAADDAAAILAAGAGKGSTETVRNAVRIVRDASWAPVPRTLHAIAGGPEKEGPRPSFISSAQIAAMKKKVRPGDLIFERRDWALSNIGLPGFWSHVAMYVGTPAERRTRFGDAFEERLRGAATYPRVGDASVIEAVGEGVIANTFERSADADYVAILRPNVNSETIENAIVRAFSYVGRPYDFEFDFASDDKIVCTELVYKSFEGALQLPVMHLAGHPVTPANDYVRWFDETFDRGRQLDFVAFVDGSAARRNARESGVTALRASWKRPRWYAVETQ